MDIWSERHPMSKVAIVSGVASLFFTWAAAQSYITHEQGKPAIWDDFAGAAGMFVLFTAVAIVARLAMLASVTQKRVGCPDEEDV